MKSSLTMSFLLAGLIGVLIFGCEESKPSRLTVQSPVDPVAEGSMVQPSAESPVGGLAGCKDAIVSCVVGRGKITCPYTEQQIVIDRPSDSIARGCDGVEPICMCRCVKKTIVP